MTVYIALLRGINVGGKNIIKMADLRQMFASLGMQCVRTYIQSGNVLFESDEEETALRQKVENEIKNVFGLTVPVVLRTAEEMNWIANKCPFSEKEILEAESTCEGESLYVAMLAEQPSQEGIERLQVYNTDKEKFRVSGRDVFLLFHQSIRNSKLANNLGKLEVTATVRNWKTVNKLVALTEQ